MTSIGHLNGMQKPELIDRVRDLEMEMKKHERDIHRAYKSRDAYRNLLVEARKAEMKMRLQLQTIEGALSR